jgi:hypothetical protein
MTSAKDPVSVAAALHNRGRSQEAYDLLAPAMAAGLRTAQAHHLMGLIQLKLGDPASCERDLRAALQLEPAAAPAARALSGLLKGQGRIEEALRVQTDQVEVSAGHPDARLALAELLYACGREDEAEAEGRRAIGAEGARPAGRRPDAWLFLARLFNRQARLDDAETMLRAALACDPASAVAHRELAQLVWMRTADPAKARAALDTAPPTPTLTAILVQLLQDMGEAHEASRIASMRSDLDPTLNLMAARAAVLVDPEAADRRLAAVPSTADPIARLKAEVEIALALGQGRRAAAGAESLCGTRPDDHYATALLAAAWRMAGDPRYYGLYDYPRMVRIYRIETPEGWANMNDYLFDLEKALDQVHAHLTHPIGQSLRHGSQTLRGLEDYPHPEIRALFRAIDAPIRTHLALFGGGDHRIAGAWSVRLNRDGFHIDHVHAEGFLSSAFYVRVPEGLKDREGWIRFGQPGTPTRPQLEAEHFVRPEPGLLVLFPSFMWHGTVPFAADQTRLTCAFDIVRR